MRGRGQAGALMFLPWEGGGGDGQNRAGVRCRARLAHSLLLGGDGVVINTARCCSSNSLPTQSGRLRNDDTLSPPPCKICWFKHTAASCKASPTMVTGGCKASQGPLQGAAKRKIPDLMSSPWLKKKIEIPYCD